MIVNKNKVAPNLPRNQQGAVLIVSLVILLVMTLIGVSSMQSAGMQQKMAGNSTARQVAFSVAEAALAKAEENLVANFDHGTDKAALLQSCSSGSATCYDSTCAGGLCFNGSFATGDDERACTLTHSMTPHWVDPDIWGTASTHITYTPEQYFNGSAKYIVEFMCYVDKDELSDCSASATDSSGCAALFRITSLAQTSGVSAKVMLQSHVRIVY